MNLGTEKAKKLKRNLKKKYEGIMGVGKYLPLL